MLFGTILQCGHRRFYDTHNARTHKTRIHTHKLATVTENEKKRLKNTSYLIPLILKNVSTFKQKGEGLGVTLVRLNW